MNPPSPVLGLLRAWRDIMRLLAFRVLNPPSVDLPPGPDAGLATDLFQRMRHRPSMLYSAMASSDVPEA